MKDIYISDIKTHQELISYFLVKTSAVKVGSNKKADLDLLLADCTGEISAKKWDIADEELPGLEKIKEGSIIKVKAQVLDGLPLVLAGFCDHPGVGRPDVRDPQSVKQPCRSGVTRRLRRRNEVLKGFFPEAFHLYDLLPEPF